MIALVDFLSDDDLVNLAKDKGLLDATRQAARSELSKRKDIKFKGDDL